MNGPRPSAALVFLPEELEGNIIRRFQRVVQQLPHHRAVSQHDVQLTYASLDSQSDGLAASLLQSLGDAKEPVAMLYQHGAHYNVVQLAVLKTGKFHANIDPELPAERQQLILANLEARVLLCDAACHAQALALANWHGSLQVINTADVPASNDAVNVEISATDPAFIVYTSGSTGEPQGVVLTHRNVLMIARSHGQDFHLGPSDRASQLCALWTAASGSEIFSTLLNGATLYPYSIKQGGVFGFLKLAEAEALTTFTGTPILFRMLFGAAGSAQTFPAMRLLRLGGDRTTRKDVQLYKRLFGEHCVLRLGYGSSEYLLVTQFFIDQHYEMAGEIAPVGFAMPGCSLRLLNDERQQVKRGEFGEIAVTSRHLSPGYWKNPSLTSQRFLANSDDPELRTYLTRDIGFLDNNGCLHHVGRSDSCVKIYGKMVAMGDVEARLLAIKGVKEAVVLPYDGGVRGTELAAFVLVADDTLDESSLRKLLQEQLVAEVIPRRITVLDRMPLQINNKINRLKLKELARTSA